VDTVVNGVLLPAMQTLAYALITATLTVFIIIMNPLLTIVALGLFGTIYGLLYVFSRSKLTKYGRDAREAGGINKR
jgi:hypothetical protein